MNALFNTVGTGSPTTPPARVASAPAADSNTPAPSPGGDAGVFTRALLAARQAERSLERQRARQAEDQAQAGTGPKAPTAPAEGGATAADSTPSAEDPAAGPSDGRPTRGPEVDEAAAAAAALALARAPLPAPESPRGEPSGPEALDPGPARPARGANSDVAPGLAPQGGRPEKPGPGAASGDAGQATGLPAAGQATAPAAARNARAPAGAVDTAPGPAATGLEAAAIGLRPGRAEGPEAGGAPGTSRSGLGAGGPSAAASAAGPGATAPPGSAAFAPLLAGQAGAASWAPAEASLPAAPGSPQFAPQLSAQISTFVRQGVEQARLHLNPAELGPVELRIRIEGDQAQVLMAADLSLTRASLEQALPALAAGLREAGLTLAGGGVFDTASGALGQAFAGAGNGSRDGGEPGGTRKQSDPAAWADGPAGPTLHDHQARTAPLRRGLVDLVA